MVKVYWANGEVKASESEMQRTELNNKCNDLNQAGGKVNREWVVANDMKIIEGDRKKGRMHRGIDPTSAANFWHQWPPTHMNVG